MGPLGHKVIGPDVVPVGRPEPHAGAVVEPQASPLGLPLGNLHPLAPERTYNLVFFPNTLLYEMAVADKIISGERDCGYQLDYLAGLNTQGAEWKNRNLYLNSILYLMAGKITPRRLGIIPRALLEPMIRESMIRFNNRNRSLSLTFIAMKMQLMRLRSRIAEQVKKFHGDPTAVYYLRSRRR
jgi:hypothetical protein